ERSRAFRPGWVVAQGVAAASADRRAVDRPGGPRGRGQAPAQVVGGGRRVERRGRRRAGAAAGTLRRRRGSEAAVRWSARMIGDLLQAARVRVVVDALRAAQPHTMGIGDRAIERLDDLAFVDRALRGRAEAQQQLTLGVLEEVLSGALPVELRTRNQG